MESDKHMFVCIVVQYDGLAIVPEQELLQDLLLFPHDNLVVAKMVNSQC